MEALRRGYSPFDSNTSLVPRRTDLIFLERGGARAPKFPLNGGASKGLLLLLLVLLWLFVIIIDYYFWFSWLVWFRGEQIWYSWSVTGLELRSGTSMEWNGARVPTLRLNGGASKGLLSLRLGHKSGSTANRLDILGARRSSRSEVAPQGALWRGYYYCHYFSLLFLITIIDYYFKLLWLVWFRGEQTWY